MPSYNSYKKNNSALGRSYEQLAAHFFEENGFKILERNYRFSRKEIDLIAFKDNLIVFIEVKASSSQKFGHPAERVDLKKIHNISEVAQQYIISNNISNVDMRFDVITFTNGQLEHFPNAFEVSE